MNEGKDINITISSGTIVRAVLLVVLVLGLFYIKDVVLVILAAVVIASSIEPVTLWAEKKKVKRIFAVIGIYLILAVILFIFFIFFLPSLLNEAITYLNNLPQNISMADIWSPLRDVGNFSTNSMVLSLSDKTFSLRQIIEVAQSIITGTGESTFITVSSIFGGVLSFIFMIIISFYLAVKEDGVADFLRIVTPVKKHEYIINLWKRSQKKIGYWMQGQLVLGIIIGVLVYIGLMILGVKHALLLASIAACFELIPVFGPILSSVPAILIAFVDGGTTSGILVIFLYIIIHQFENHLLYPLVVRKIVGISPILVILSLIIGAKLAGFLGAILAVPVVSAIMEYVEDIEKRKKTVKSEVLD